MEKTGPNVIDKVLAATILKLIPGFISPNHVTVFRFLTVPFVLYLLLTEDYLYATILFSISAFTDALDGAMARVRNQITDWGRKYDPIADKFLIGGSAAVLIYGNMNTVLAFLVILIELMIGATAIYQAKFRGVILNPHWTGKLKMVLQSVGIGLLLFSNAIMLDAGFAIAEIIIFVALIFAIISLVVYKSA